MRTTVPRTGTLRTGSSRATSTICRSSRPRRMPILKYVVAGWQVGGVTTIQSGTPVNVTISADRANIGISGLQRPDLIGSVPTLNCQPNQTTLELINCFDASAFAMPAQFTFGNAPRNLLRGPKLAVTDLSLMKNIPIGGTYSSSSARRSSTRSTRSTMATPMAVFGSATFGRISRPPAPEHASGPAGIQAHVLNAMHHRRLQMKTSNRRSFIKRGATAAAARHGGRGSDDGGRTG